MPFHRERSLENVQQPGTTGRRIGTIRRMSGMFHHGKGNGSTLYEMDEDEASVTGSVNDSGTAELIGNTSSSTLLQDESSGSNDQVSSPYIAKVSELPKTGTARAGDIEFSNVRAKSSTNLSGEGRSRRGSTSGSSIVSAPGPGDDNTMKRTLSVASTQSSSNRLTNLFMSRRQPSIKRSDVDQKADSDEGIGRLKRHDSLSIQTAIPLLPTKDTRSPLARTSKEVERIAGYGSMAAVPERLSLNSPTTQQTKWKSRHHFRRQRRDSLKSSSNSNSQVSESRDTAYSFHPQSNSSSLSTEQLQKMIKEFENMNIEEESFATDKSAVADEAWSIFCALVFPLFQGGRLRAPVEEINKLVYLHSKLCADIPSGMDSPTVAYAPLYSPVTNSTAVTTTTMTSPYLNSPTPTRSSPSPTISPMRAGMQTKESSDVQEFLKAGMETMMSLLYFDENDYTVKLGRSRPGRNPRSFSTNAQATSDLNFERSCSLLWDMFYDDVYFYLGAVFLPLDAANDPRNNRRKMPISDMVLRSFRDHIIIPLYEMNRQREIDRERSATTTTHSSRNNVEPSEESYTLNIGLQQCFTILNSVQTNDTNQKIIENLKQQTRERCLIYESIK